MLTGSGTAFPHAGGGLARWAELAGLPSEPSRASLAGGFPLGSLGPETFPGVPSIDGGLLPALSWQSGGSGVGQICAASHLEGVGWSLLTQQWADAGWSLWVRTNHQSLHSLSPLREKGPFSQQMCLLGCIKGVCVTRN